MLTRLQTIGKGRKAPAAINQPSITIPLLHMFQFHRRVIDEYHYLSFPENSTVRSLVKSISADKLWALSGTPNLTNFSDVNEMASFLGVKLGRDYCGDGVTTTNFEEKLKAGQTRVERFLANMETPSYQWHLARHQSAQNFLNGKYSSVESYSDTLWL